MSNPNGAFSPSITVCSGPEGLAGKAREAILQIIEAKGAKEKTSLALSGGSTPKALYELLHEKDLPLLRDEKRVLFFMGDDRLYPLDHEQSNFHMATKTLLRDVPAECVLPVDVTAALPTSEDTESGAAGAKAVADAYAQTLLSALPHTVVNNVPVPVADIVLLGFGADGHTASVFPGSVASTDETSAVSIGFPSPSMTPKVWRVTLTPMTICNAANVIVLCAGAEKKWVVDGILADACPAEPQCPVSRFLRQCKGKVHFILDESCAPTSA